MNAFTSSSLKTFLFSILFATLLVLTAGQTPSSGEDVEQIEQQKGFETQDEYITPEIVEQTNNFWPPVHLRGLRSSNGKPTFIRFGKRASPSFIRFGRK
ncbi:hypothetical protein GCK72_005166 [Caenorhabditis remanei]|uniref:CRE-FLP-4 protein n=2 Tax=Caenorhabditis remanei TaxID=31234 RepID=E3LH16_CAERE|nr:hypothetical protein GCK72_005166 [Caenorhabditis remanei]EFO85953.1 CRE-FLP-4 protein [Caenorhabditis remanei]KAF1765214.1 hypothetical protein GCK72_005166 [Caenorhabditis remanei]